MFHCQLSLSSLVTSTIYSLKMDFFLCPTASESPAYLTIDITYMVIFIYLAPPKLFKKSDPRVFPPYSLSVSILFGVLLSAKAGPTIIAIIVILLCVVQLPFDGIHNIHYPELLFTIRLCDILQMNVCFIELF